MTDLMVENQKTEIGRNEPCPCGSGKKYKRCCLETGGGAADHWISSGQVFETRGLPERALVCYEKAVAFEAENATAHLKMGAALLGIGRPADAAKCFAAALELQGNSLDAINGLGTALHRIGRIEAAIVCFKKALSLDEENISALNSCGVACCDLGHVDDAIVYFQRALTAAPKQAAVLANLGEAYRRKGDLDQSIQCLKRAIDLKPDLGSSYANLALSYEKQGRLRKAISTYRTALELDPRNARAYCNLAFTLVEQDKVEEALENYGKAIELAPAENGAYSNMLYLYSTFQFATPERECELAAGWEKARLTSDERAAARARASVSIGVFSAEPRLGRPLRVGIVSAELGRHAVAVFLQPFLDHFDYQRLHLTLFPTVLKKDPLAAHFRSLAQNTISLIGMPDAPAAERIRREQIDVLIDTTGHTSDGRLGIFAHRAAPVQCSYIGYWSTTGLTEMDWYITDDNYAGGCEAHFTEKLWKLPHCAHCYHGNESLPASEWLPDPDGTVWLGSFNRYNKIRRETLLLWAKVLNAVPHAKLLLEDRAVLQAETHERIRAVLREHSISGDRVVFLPAVVGGDYPTHMRLHDRVDIALDTIPANSGTTAFDALWMGVPLVALQGERVCGRMAASILKLLGRPEWIADTPEQYVSIVSTLAQDVRGRASVRASLRSEMKKSELCDGAGLARTLEDAFEAMHDRWRLSS